MTLDPVVFANGNEYFDRLARDYITHKKGYFIMSPSGAGKTYFCKRQTEPHWIDGDILWLETKAQPEIEWWNGGVPMINRVEQRCDVITAEAIDRGFWILGSVNYWLQPDAIVIPPWDTLTRHIKARQHGDYDGGLTDAHFDQLKNHIEVITKWHTDYGVPMFESIDEATNALASAAE